MCPARAPQDRSRIIIPAELFPYYKKTHPPLGSPMQHQAKTFMLKAPNASGQNATVVPTRCAAAVQANMPQVILHTLARKGFGQSRFGYDISVRISVLATKATPSYASTKRTEHHHTTGQRQPTRGNHCPHHGGQITGHQEYRFTKRHITHHSRIAGWTTAPERNQCCQRRCSHPSCALLID